MLDLLGIWFIRYVLRRSGESAIPHVEPDESDWTWDTEEMDGYERMTIADEMEGPAASKFFGLLPAIFESGFGDSQVTVLQNQIGRMRLGEVRTFDFNARWHEMPSPFQMALRRVSDDDFAFEISTRKELAEALQTFLVGYRETLDAQPSA